MAKNTVKIPAKKQMGNGSMKPKNPAQKFDSTKKFAKPTFK